MYILHEIKLHHIICLIYPLQEVSEVMGVPSSRSFDHGNCPCLWWGHLSIDGNK